MNVDIEFVTLDEVARQILDDLHRASVQTGCASEAAELKRQLYIAIARVTRNAAANLDEKRLRQAVSDFMNIKDATARLIRQAAAMDTSSGSIH